MDRPLRRRGRIVPQLFAALILGFMTGATATAASWRVTFRGQGTAAGETPVVAKIDARIPAGDYLLRPEKGDAIPAQVFELDKTKYLGTVLRTIPAEGTMIYVMTPNTDSGESRKGVEFRATGGNLDVRIAGHPFTVYRTDEPTKPYFWPVIGPTGTAITRAYPMEAVAGEDRDHPHQRSLWFTFGNVNGYDFWAPDPLNKPSPKFGKIKETSRKTISGPALGVLRTTDDWLGPDGKAVCSDERTVTFYDTTQGRVFDFDVTMKAPNEPVTFNDTKEGMFGFRVASSMDSAKTTGGKIINAEGVTNEAAWGKASPWVDYTGPLAGKTVGIAILNHPDSFRHPTTWHVRPYGLFAANPFGGHDFGQKESGTHSIPAGESIRVRYRVFLHEGDTVTAKVAEAFSTYAKPPSVEIKAE